jgi:predicted RNA-binding protein with PUA domain
VSAPKKWLLTLVQGFYSVTPWTDFLENGWKKMLKSNGCPSMLEKRKKRKTVSEFESRPENCSDISSVSWIPTQQIFVYENICDSTLLAQC